MGVEKQLVQDAESTVRRHERAERTLYLTYNPGAGAREALGQKETCVVQIKLPRNATNISLRGPGNFTKRGKEKIYGVQISFTEEVEPGKESTHTRTIELPHPAVDVQLLDRTPDEAYKAVA